MKTGLYPLPPLPEAQPAAVVRDGRHLLNGVTVKAAGPSPEQSAEGLRRRLETLLPGARLVCRWAAEEGGYLLPERPASPLAVYIGVEADFATLRNAPVGESRLKVYLSSVVTAEARRLEPDLVCRSEEPHWIDDDGKLFRPDRATDRWTAWCGFYERRPKKSQDRTRQDAPGRAGRNTLDPQHGGDGELPSAGRVIAEQDEDGRIHLV